MRSALLQQESRSVFSEVDDRDGGTHFRFGVFTFDSTTLELFRTGRLVPLAPQPAHLLATLLARPGQLVTRDEIRRTLWPTTVVEFDSGLNTCIRQIRSALGENARSPTFIETLPRRGYRFIAPVQRGPVTNDGDKPVPGRTRSRSYRAPMAWLAATVAAGVAAFTMFGGGRQQAAVSVSSDEVTVPEDVRFEYLRGRHLLGQIGRDRAGAVAAFEEVVEGAPEFALGWSGLATAQLWTNGAPNREQARTAENAARRSITIDPTVAEAHLVLAQVAFGRLELVAAGAHFASALELAPTSAEVHNSYAYFALVTGERQLALRHAHLAYEIDPVSALLLHDAGVFHLWSGDADSAIRLCEQAVSLDPSIHYSRWCLARAYEARGDDIRAKSAALKAMILQGAVDSDVAAVTGLPAEIAMDGYRRWRIRELEVQTSPGGHYQVAALYAAGCRVPEALRHLELAAIDPPMQMTSMAVDPAFACLEGESAFRGLLQRLGLPQLAEG